MSVQIDKLKEIQMKCAIDLDKIRYLAENLSQKYIEEDLETHTLLLLMLEKIIDMRRKYLEISQLIEFEIEQ